MKLIDKVFNETQDHFLSEENVPANPIDLFSQWLNYAEETGMYIFPGAMTLSTSDSQSRIVLLKDFSEKGFVFYTNYDSPKSRSISDSNIVSLLFYWPGIERQVRINGRAEKVSREESQAYFATRPRESRIGAWASGQSGVVSSRAELEEHYKEWESKFEGEDVPCPENWGGFNVVADSIEFWQLRPFRFHDRIRYSEPENGNWKIERLSP